MKKILSFLLLLFLSSQVIASHTEYPRGIRNNNPGNLIKTSIPWKGKVECESDKKFECFSSPYYGIRAMTKTVKAYIHRHKIKYFSEFFNRWSPPSENNTRVITYYFEKRFPYQDMWNVDLQSFVNELIYLENGRNPYSYKLIKEVFKDVFPNSSRDYNRPRWDLNRWITKNMGDETTGPSRSEQGSIQSFAAKDQGTTEGLGGKGQGGTVDTAYNSLDSSILHHSITKTGSAIYGYNRYRGMDRDRKWVPILYGEQGGITVERVKWTCNNTFRYTYCISDSGNVFRGFPSGA